jgi:hypothetical protein
MNNLAFLLFIAQKYSSFNPPYFPKRSLKFVLDSIPACSASQPLLQHPLEFSGLGLDHHYLKAAAAAAATAQKWRAEARVANVCHQNFSF